MSFKSIEEGLTPDKPPEQVTQAEIDAINGRLLLADTAAADGINVDERIDRWERELATAQAFDSVKNSWRG